MPPFSDARPASSNSTGRFLKHISALLLRTFVVRRRRRGHRPLAGRHTRLLVLDRRLLLLGPLGDVLAPLGCALLAAIAPAADGVVDLVTGLAQRPGIRPLPRPP